MTRNVLPCRLSEQKQVVAERPQNHVTKLRLRVSKRVTRNDVA